MTGIEMYMPKGGVQGHAGQATMVEASRAMEEVRAQVVLARQFPRDVAASINRIGEMFRVKAMADRAFYSYRKGGATVAGSTIWLAKGVAQAWGNLTYGIDELSRIKGQSEMRAWAWDLETNQRVSTTFIVQHAMDVKGGLKELEDLRSIYENNANMGNRRLRAQIESVIPAYVMDMAKDVATQTLQDGGGDPLPVRVDKAVKAFAELGVQAEQLEKEIGRPSGKWTGIDLGRLRVLMTSIRQGEITVADAFPPVALSVEDARPVTPVVPKPAPAAGRATEDLHLWTEEQIAESFPGAYREGPELIVPRAQPGPVWEQPEESAFEESAAWSPADGGTAASWPTVAQPGGSE